MERLRFVVLWGAAGLCEIPISMAVLAGFDAPWTWIALGHAAAVMLALATSYHSALGRPWALWLALWVLFLPGVGWLFGLVMVAGSRWGDVQDHVDDSEEVLPASALPIVSTPRESTALVARELDFLPLVDVMAGSDVDLKRSAIEQLARLRTTDAIQVLMRYRRDPSLEVRFYVNSALSQIKKEFDESLDAARRQMQLDIYKISARVFLAKVYLQYAQSGLLDHDLVQVYEDEAIFHLTYAIESEHAIPEAYRMLVASTMARGEWERALAVVEKSRESGVGFDSEMQQQYVRILFHLKRYDAIQVAMKTMYPNEKLPQDWQTAALWWGAT